MSVLRVFLVFAVESFARDRKRGKEVLVDEVNTRSVKQIKKKNYR